MNKSRPLNWKMVHDNTYNEKGEYTECAQVEGGWLYKTVIVYPVTTDYNKTVIAMVFVPAKENYENTN